MLETFMSNAMSQNEEMFQSYTKGMNLCLGYNLVLGNLLVIFKKK